MNRRQSKDSIGDYLSSINRIPVLTAAEENELALHVQNMKLLLKIPEIERTIWHREKIRMGKKARNRLMEANLRLLVAIAKEYQNQGLELLDLIQEGSMGLEKAVDKFDLSKGYKFSTYAYWWIRIGIKRVINKKKQENCSCHNGKMQTERCITTKLLFLWYVLCM